MAYIGDLRVYTRSLEFSNNVWDKCIKWDYFAKRTVGNQLVRAADSISANIAEGYGRYNIKDNIHFCYYSRGSLEEVKDWLQKSKSRKLISVQEYNVLQKDIEIISKDLWSYIKSLKKRINS
ncbi:MAG: four helix bundle protein [Candidatus Cloacimonetes bacterium]|nr:four helix bundle protein [Candidatus Cloacimonadota bacterium]MBL7086590.1 four helix bundle protein [Candidatus Cloacimonadota bacterium]